MAMQTWDYDTMTFLPQFNLLEFISEEEQLKSENNPLYQPQTLLLDQVQAGENYELVITNRLGGAFVRYRLGDMMTIAALRNEKLDIDIPQMLFYYKANHILELAGFAKLTEDVLWRALERAEGLTEEWTASREVTQETPILQLYVELGDHDRRSALEIREAMHRQLKLLDRPYAEIELLLGRIPIEVTLLPSGSFGSYARTRKAAGGGQAISRPPRLHPSEADLRMLQEMVPEPDRISVA